MQADWHAHPQDVRVLRVHWETALYLVSAALFVTVCYGLDAYGGLAVARGGCALFTVLGVAGLAYAWYLSTRGGAVTSWTPVQARILASGVASGSPGVRYEYAVDGRTYTSTKVAFDLTCGPGEARAVVDRYPAGALVVAFIDPANTGTAVLEPALKPPPRTAFSLSARAGGMFTVCGTLGWFLMPLIRR